MLDARLFGQPKFRMNGLALEGFATGRPAALLVYLMVTGQPQSRATLVELLWDADSEQKARNNLRYVLRDLRKIVGDYLEVAGEMLAFNQNLPHWVDSAVFTTHLRRITTGGQAAGPESLAELLDLYKGEFLDGFQVADAPFFDDWLTTQRRYMHDLYIQALHMRIHHLLATADYASGLELNRHLLALEPWREEIHCQQMLLLAHLNQRGAALQQYKLCVQALSDELDVQPMPQTTALYEQIKSGQWYAEQQSANRNGWNGVSVPAAPRTDGPTNGYTGVLSATPVAGGPKRRVDLGAMQEDLHFRGRDEQLSILRQRICRESYPLVAILGLPGQGKSALAAAFVQEICDDENLMHHKFRHVIWRSLARSQSCIDTLQDWLLGLEAEPRRLPASFDQLVSRLFARLDEQRCLLVLDGVETVLAEDADADAYHKLFHLFMQRRHQSCLLLTSRCRPHSLNLLNERDRAFHLLELGGLSSEDSMGLLTDHHLDARRDLLALLTWKYAGNPGLINRAGNLIHEVFGGDVDAFVKEGLFFLGDIGAELSRYLRSLSPLESSLLEALAAADTPPSRASLWQQMETPPDRGSFLLALRSLQNRCLIRQTDGRICLAEVLSEFLAPARTGPVRV